MRSYISFFIILLNLLAFVFGFCRHHESFCFWRTVLLKTYANLDADTQFNCEYYIKGHLIYAVDA